MGQSRIFWKGTNKLVQTGDIIVHNGKTYTIFMPNPGIGCGGLGNKVNLSSNIHGSLELYWHVFDDRMERKEV